MTEKAPVSTSTEGGGLSSLHDRVKKSGGTMSINSYPYFRACNFISAQQGGNTMTQVLIVEDQKMIGESPENLVAQADDLFSGRLAFLCGACRAILYAW